MSFGDQLRELRRSHGLTQQGLAQEMGQSIARSTLANVEVGREAPSPRLWSLLLARFPDEAPALTGAYETARSEVGGTRRQRAANDDEPVTLGGPFALERLTLAYTFRESRSPEEVIEVRRLRALARGARHFGLRYESTRAGEFETTSEVLWGGRVTTVPDPDAPSSVLRRVTFDRPLRRGERHEFGMRTWIERDPEPAREVTFCFTVPAQQVVVQLNFLGRVHPRSVSRAGPADSDDEIVRAAHEGAPVPLLGRSASATFQQPELKRLYGVAWDWCEQDGCACA